MIRIQIASGGKRLLGDMYPYFDRVLSEPVLSEALGYMPKIEKRYEEVLVCNPDPRRRTRR